MPYGLARKKVYERLHAVILPFTLLPGNAFHSGDLINPPGFSTSALVS